MRPLVQRLGYIALNVTNLDAACEDAVNIAGVHVVDNGSHRALLTSNSRHAELVLHKAESNEVRCIGLQAVDSDAVDEVARRVKAAGLEILSRVPSLDCIEKSVTFVTSEGHVFEVHSAMPDDRPRRYLGPGVHPRCLDHVNLSAADPKRIAEELEKTVGLRLVERTTGYEIMWMRAADNRHHTVAAVKGPSGIHHFSWEFSSFEDFKSLADTLDADDRVLVWGPGRHGAGDNLFAYYVDRSGFLVECIAEMELIHEEGFEPRVSDPGENLSNIKVVNRWGAPPPLAWIQHHNTFARLAISNLGEDRKHALPR